MKKKIKVAAAAVNQIPLDWAHNRDNLIEVLKEASHQNVEVLCCPELAITGYGCEDAFLAKNTSEMALEILKELIPYTAGFFTALGLPLWHNHSLYNVAAVVSNGKLLGFIAKQHLAGYGIHYEPRWFKSWPKGKIETLQLNPSLFGQMDYPLGDLIFHIGDVKIGLEICEDAWVSERTGIKLAERGVDLILNPSASHFAFYKYPIRQHFILEGAKRFGVGYIYANLLGNEAGRLIYDGDTLIATPEGFLATGNRFSFRSFTLVSTDIDIERLRLFRDSNFSNEKGSEAGTSNISQDHASPDHSSADHSSSSPENSKTSPAWETSPHVKEEEFTRATALALFDYLRKSKTQGFVLNLSGGADSSSCLCLIYLMIKLACKELGENGFREKLKPIVLPSQESDFLKKLLYCLYQKTENNSEKTFTLARDLALSLKASFYSFSIDEIIKHYGNLVSPILERSLSWETDDHALQNIQARARAPSAWLVANVLNALLISPSNRSEAAVGYATMDGDTCGSISPLAGVDKSFIQQWLRWLADIGPEEIGNLPELNNIIAQKPSAELRPQSYAQTDEEDLMPYAWLDRMERMLVLEKLSPLEIFQAMKKHYPNEDPESLLASLKRFLKLWSQNQWKRERLAPSFHLDNESVDPKTYCRYPILGGDYSFDLVPLALRGLDFS